MKNKVSFCILFYLGFSLSASAQEAAPGEYLVKLKPKSWYFQNEGRTFSAQTGSFVQSTIHGQNILVVKRPSFEYPSSAIEVLSQNPDVEVVEPNYILHTLDKPNDRDYGTMWQLYNINRTAPVIDINIEKAWKITTGSDDVVVGILDSGIDYTHPDLKANMWTNEAEFNGQVDVDDDNNGFVDDIHGYNFADDKGDAMDNGEDSHGTHCAGSIGARGNNRIGITGVNWKVKLMALKFIGDNGMGKTSNAIRALDYAIQMGVRITSNSWGGGGNEGILLKQAVQRTAKAGMLFVVAAGNSKNNNDVSYTYPASYRMSNMISVASVDRNGALAQSSNYGQKTVDLAAPGVEIYSTAIGGKYEVHSGTSMAAPFVAGVAALILSQNPNIDVKTLRKCILNSVTPLNSLTEVTSTGGLLNAYGALTNDCQ